MWDYTAFLSLVLLSHILTRCLIFGLTLQDTFLKSDFYPTHVKKAGKAFLKYIQVKDSMSDVIFIKTVTQSTSFADADEYNGIYQKANKMPAFTFSLKTRHPDEANQRLVHLAQSFLFFF